MCTASKGCPFPSGPDGRCRSHLMQVLDPAPYTRLEDIYLLGDALNDAGFISASTAGRALGVTRGYVNDLAREGKIAREPDGRFDLEKVRAAVQPKTERLKGQTMLEAWGAKLAARKARSEAPGAR